MGYLGNQDKGAKNKLGKAPIITTTAVDDTTNSGFGIVFTSATTGNLVVTKTSSALSWNPSTGTLSATSFSGSGSNLSGVAKTVSGLSQFPSASTTSAQLATVLTDETGTGSLVFANSPTLITPLINILLGSSANAGYITIRGTSSSTKGNYGVVLDENIASTNSSTGTLVVAGGIGVGGRVSALNFNGVGLSGNGSVSFPANNSVTITTTGTTAITLPVSGTLVSTSSKLSAFAATSSAELAGVISDETGTGKLVFATSPTLITPILGVATATSLNGYVLNQTGTPANGNSTLIATYGKSYTLPAANANLAALDVAQNFTAAQNFSSVSVGGAQVTPLYQFTYTSSQTNVNINTTFAGASMVMIEMLGAGGSGGVRTTGTAGHITGGGGGEYIQACFPIDYLKRSGNTTFSFSCGVGGAAVAASSANGNAGGNSTFTAGTFSVVAYGGAGGTTGGSGAALTIPPPTVDHTGFPVNSAVHPIVSMSTATASVVEAHYYSIVMTGTTSPTISAVYNAAPYVDMMAGTPGQCVSCTSTNAVNTSASSTANSTLFCFASNGSSGSYGAGTAGSTPAPGCGSGAACAGAGSLKGGDGWLRITAW